LIELANLATLADPARVPPTLLLYGELDATIPRAGIDELARRLGDRCTLRIYPQRHHLLLHERDADEVFDECLRWLNAASAGPRGRAAPAAIASPTAAHT
jgi:alpha-beta hydrolase superfamily lysophospholipase